jgi:CO dehydrogenase/acetyl-CoA synthase beta subunit
VSTKGRQAGKKIGQEEEEEDEEEEEEKEEEGNEKEGLHFSLFVIRYCTSAFSQLALGLRTVMTKKAIPRLSSGSLPTHYAN